MNNFLRIPNFTQVRIIGFLLLTTLFFKSEAQTIQTFNASGTFTMPTAAGLTTVTVQAWGGGGGGGTGAGRNRGGGGGGAYASSVLTLAPGTTYTVTVGAGGAQGVAGTNSSFNTNSVIAAGGSASLTTAGGAGGTVAASTGTIKWPGGAGGTASNGNNDGGAGGGGSAFTTSTGLAGANNTAGTPGAGGNGTGAGGNGGANNQVGSGGNQPGGGGGGRGDGGGNSGTGAAGRVIVTYTCPSYSTTSISTSTICANNSALITLNGTASSLPVGNYVVTYNLGAPNAATGLTANVNVTTAGTASFSTPVLNNAGNTSITITTITSGSCIISQSSGNTSTIVVRPMPLVSVSATPSVCLNGSATVIFTNPQSFPVTAIYNINGGGNLSVNIAANSSTSIAVATNTPAVYNYNLVSASYQTAPSCSNVIAGTATTTVNALPNTFVVTGGGTICNGGTGLFVGLNGSESGVNYQLLLNSVPVGSAIAGTGSAFDFGLFTAAGTYTISATNSTTNCQALMSGNATIVVNVRPTAVITGTTTICNGSSANLNINVTGSGTISGTLSNGLSFSGTAPLIAVSVSPTSTTSYTVISLTDALCSAIPADLSGTAQVTVNEPVSITTQPVLTQAVCINGNATFSVAATGTGLSYQWYKGNTIISNGGRFAGANTAVLTISAVTPTDAAADYNVLISGTSPCASVTSSNSALIVNQDVIFTSQPILTQTVCEGTSVSISATATGTGPFTYQWYFGNTPLNTGVSDVSDATTITTTLQINPANAANTGNYSVSIAPVGGSCPADVSGISVLNVQTISADPTSASASATTICNGQSTTLTLTGGGGGTGEIIKWYTASCGGTLAGTGNNLSVSPAATTTYFGRYETAAPCSSISNCASVTINVNTVSANPTSATASATTICSGQNTMLTLNGGGGGTGEIIKWYTSSCGGTLAGTGNNLSVSPASTTTYFGRYETTAPCSSISNCATVTITVNIISANPTSATASAIMICNGQSTTLTLNGGGGGTGETIKWYTSTCGGALAGTGNNLSVSPTITTTYYGRYETNAPCSANSNCASVTITVNAAPANPTSASASATTICTGQNTTLTLNGGGGGTGEIIRWYTASCGGTLIGTGNNLSVSPSATTTYFGRYETAAPCSVNSICASVTITVNTIAANPTSATATATTICNGQSTTLTLNGGGGGTGSVIRWYTSSCGGSLAGTGNNLSVSPAITTTYFGRYENGAPCSTNTTCATVTITVNNVAVNPVSATASATTICNGQSTTLTLNGGGGGTSQVIRWYTASCGGTLAGTGNNLSVSPTATTTYFGRYETPAPCLTNTLCASVTITVNQTATNPVSASATPASICIGGSSSLSISGGNAGTGGVIRWYTASCGGTLAGTGNNLSVSPTATTTYFGRYETTTPCSFNTICVTTTVTVNQLATANAGNNISLCGNSSQATPSGATSINVTAGATASNQSSVLWTSSGTGTFVNANSLTLATYTPSAADKLAGSVTLTLTAIGISPCGNATSTKTLTIGATIVNKVDLSSVCSAGNTAIVVISQGSPAVSGGNGSYSYQWQFSTPGNSNYLNITGETGASLSVSQPANNGFYRRVITSGGCTSYSADVHVNANNVLLASSFSVTGGGAYCSGGSGVAIGLSNSIDGLPEFFVTYKLYRDGVYTGVSVQGTGAAFNFPNQTIAGTYTVQAVVSVVNGSSCAGQNVTGSAIVTIDAPIPAVSVTGNQNLCNVFISSLNGSSPAPYTGIWTLISGTGTIATPSSASSAVSGLSVGNNIFQWKVSNGTCKDSARMTIKVDPQLTIAQQPVSATFCTGENVSFTVNTTGSSPTYTWKVSTDGGLTYNNVINNVVYAGANTNTLSVTAPTLAMSGYLYQLQTVVGGACNTNLNSNIVSLYIKNYWIGNISNDWNNANNWSGNVLPSTACADVYIPAGRPNNPVLGNGTAAIQNLLIASGASLVVSNANLKIAGIINNSGSFDASNGTIEFNGSAAQTISANTFLNNAINNLTISNAAGSLTLTGTLNVFGRVSFTGTGKTFITNDFLTLKSTLNGTAAVEALAVDGAGNALNTISGKVTVEKYISALRAWRYLSIPTNTTQTIKQTWQENQAANSTSLNGFGIHITSERPTWSADGFDLYTPAGGTMKTYVPATDLFKSVTSTFNPIATTEGYMVLVRGDRTVNAFGQAPKSTILRTSGNLYMGKQPTRNVAADVFTPVGNPYASAIDFSKVAKTGGVQDVFYMWDPKLASLGAWQTFIGLGSSYFVIPGGGSYTGENTNIESGQAFLVRSIGTTGTITFEEGNKVNGSVNVARTSAQLSFIKTVLKNSTSILDGVVNIFDNGYSNNADEHDAVKLVRAGETVSIKNENKYLGAEQRQLPAQNDSIQLAIGQLRQQTYQFEFTTSNIPANVSMIFLKDKYLGTLSQIEVSGTTNVNFALNADPMSASTDRFQIIFKYLSASPVVITEIKAKKKTNNVITVNWKVAAESGVAFYSVERSIDGNNFTSIGNQRAANNLSVNEYTFDDRNFNGQYIQYRIKANFIAGNALYSDKAQVNNKAETNEISIYPNPVVNKKLNIHFNNSESMVCTISLLNNEGQEIYKENAIIPVGGTRSIQLDGKISSGSYKCIITNQDGIKNVQSVLIL